MRLRPTSILPARSTTPTRRSYTPEEALDLLNLHLMMKGFMLVKRDKLLKLFDVENDGPIPQEFVPEVPAETLAKRGEFELVKVQFQLSVWTPEAAETDIRKVLGPYGSIVTLGSARQIIVADLGGKMRMIKRMIDAVEQPDAYKDEKVVIIKLQKLTPTEFLTMCRQLFGIPEGQWQTMDNPVSPSLRLSMNDLEGIIICNGKAAMIAKVEELAKLVDVPSAKSATPGAAAPADQPQFDVYTISQADPVLTENIIRILLAGAPDARIQLDPKTGKLAVLARRARTQQVKDNPGPDGKRRRSDGSAQAPSHGRPGSRHANRQVFSMVERAPPMHPGSVRIRPVARSPCEARRPSSRM